jgi:hypothetical protein
LPNSQQPKTANQLLESIQLGNEELVGDTFNPSMLFDDKSQAEWFGNIVSNREDEAIRAMHAQAHQLPRWIFFVLIGFGAMIGFIAAIWLMGAFNTKGSTSPSSANTGLPTPPPAYTPPNTTSTSTAGQVILPILHGFLMVVVGVLV